MAKSKTRGALDSVPAKYRNIGEPKPKFMVIGKGKYVHVFRTEKWDRKHHQCQQARKAIVAGKINYKSKGISPEAAAALDPCPNCDTAGVLKSLETPEQRKERTKASREATQEKIKDASKTDGQRKKEAKRKGKGKVDTKPSKRKAKAGRTSTGDTQAKAEALAAFGKEHGWLTTVTPQDVGMMVEAQRGDEIIRCYFVDGKYDTSRHASLTVGSWTGKLRGVHGCRKQMAGEGRDRPHPNPGKGRSVSKRKAEDEVIPEDESPEDARRRVPFLVDDDPVEIIEKLLGKIIKWRNGVSGSLEEAWLPAEVRPKRGKREAKRDTITITEHPKTGKRMVTFLTVLSVNEDGEQYGPERSVYLDKIVRVQ